jgi:hypothetical protein
MRQGRPLAEEAEVARKRQLVAEEGDRRRPELAGALLDLSRAYDQADRTPDTLSAAREAVEILSPTFLASPKDFEPLMREIVTHYVALAQRSRTRPDEALLAPIAQALGDLTRAEDEAEDPNG